MSHPSSDVAFSPAVKAVQAERGSRESYANVVRANGAAQAMLAAGDMLYLDDGALAARGTREVHRALIEAIAGAMRDDVVVSPRGVAIK